MDDEVTRNWLDRPVDAMADHVLGPANAEITLVEYGSYACPYCRAANERIADIRDQLGERLRYVFRHRPVTGSDIARRAAELVEYADGPKSFWDAHIALMTRSAELTEDDLATTARILAVPSDGTNEAAAARAKARVDADIASAKASGVIITPTFFINGRRYDGAWDTTSFSEAVVGTVGHRLRTAAIDFVDWAPSAGILLLIATAAALILANSGVGPAFEALWEQYVGVAFGEASYRLSLLHWINDGLLSIFFLVVGLEMKREFTVGHLASLRAAALPIAAAVGGLIAPALVYLALIPSARLVPGWGVPMSTDTAFAVALIVMMGRRVPTELRIFLTAAAIVDDIGAILVVAFAYAGALHLGYLAGAAAVVAGLALLNRFRIYSLTPYIALGVILWACLQASGLHATIAGVILAMFIPTFPPPNLRSLMVQANTILAAEAGHSDEPLRHGPSRPAMRSIDAIHARLESPANRLLDRAGARSSYLVLPLFALANAGVAITMSNFHGHEPLMLAIVAGLIVGKPLGLVGASVLAVRLKLATKPYEYSWRQLAGAGSLAGIGFTMSLFIASQAFPDAADITAAKLAILVASALSALIGVGVLWNAECHKQAGTH